MLPRCVVLGMVFVGIVYPATGQSAETTGESGVVADTVDGMLPWFFDEWTIDEWEDFSWTAGGAGTADEDAVIATRLAWVHSPERGAENTWQARQAVRLPRLDVEVGYGRAADRLSLNAYRMHATLPGGLELHGGRTHLAAAAFHPRRRSWRAPDWRADRRSATTFAARPGEATSMTLTYAIGPNANLSLQRGRDDHLQRNIASAVTRFDWGAVAIGVSNVAMQQPNSRSTMVVVRGFYERNGIGCYGAVRAGVGMSARSGCSFAPLPLLEVSLGFVWGRVSPAHYASLAQHGERAEARHDMKLQFRVPTLNMRGSLSRYTRWSDDPTRASWRAEHYSEVWDTQLSVPMIKGRIVGRHQRSRSRNGASLNGTDRVMLRWSGAPGQFALFLTLPSGGDVGTTGTTGAAPGYNAEATIPLTRRIALTQWAYLSRNTAVYIPTVWSNGVKSARAKKGRGGGIWLTVAFGPSEKHAASFLVSDDHLGWACTLHL